MNEIVLDKWQEEILDTKGNIVVCSGRQTGKSTIVSIKAAEFMVNNPNKAVLIVSITEDQSELMIMKILDYLERNHKEKIAKGKKKPLKHQIILKNGSIVRCRPVGSTGNAIRGFTGDMLICDEAAFMPEDIFTAAKPTLLTTAGDIILISTPHGRKGYFFECFTNKHNRFKVFHISSEEVIKNREVTDGWTESQREHALEFLEDEKRDMSDLQYAQEYLGKFVEELRQLFPDELIEKACVGKRPQIADQSNVYVMGCDLARLGGDESTFEIIWKKNSGFMKQVENVVKKGLLTHKNEELIKDMAKKWYVNKVGIDAGAGTLGVSVYDHLRQDYEMKKKLVAMNNRRIVIDHKGNKTQRIFKEDMYDNLLSLMQRGEIELLNDVDLKVSLKSVQWELRKGARGETQVRIFGNYTHIAEGLIRAAWLAKEKNLNIWMTYI